MSLVPCRFYATPSGCRFGDNCKFYHARGGNNQIVPGAFGGRPQVFNTGGLGQAQQDVLNLAAKSQQNMDAMIEMVKKDMLEWENGHIYPFSCYGPSAMKPSVPGFEDISAEELRYRFYVLNNKTPIDLSREISTMQQARIQYLQVPPTIRNILERVIVKGERIDSNGMTSQQQPQQNAFQAASVFGGGNNNNNAMIQPSSNNIFGQTSTGTSLFGGGGSNTGQTSGIFGSPVGQQPQQSGSLFGGPGVIQPSAFLSSSPQPTSQASSIFGNPASPSVFGGGASQQPTLGSLFGGTNSTTGIQPQQQQGIFGGGTTTTGGLFGTSNSSATPGGTSLFGTAPTTSLFGGTSQPTTNIFPQSPSTTTTTGGGLFSSPNTLFGNSTTTNTLQTSSIFGQQPQIQQTSPFSHSPTLQGLLTAGQPQQSSNPIMGQQQPQQQQQQQTSLFGSPPVNQPQQQQSGLPSSGSFFSSPSQTLSSPSTFGVAVNLQPQTSLFGTPPTQQQPGFSSGNNPPTSLFGGGLMIPNAEQKYVYTDESELSPEELEAFRAPNFTLENIPTRPPPKSLCGV